MIIKISKISKEIKVKIPDLLTRPIGKRMYKEVKKLLSNITDGEVLLLDFLDIMVIDPSFIDEFIIKLIFDSWEKAPGFFSKLLNISDVSCMNIESVCNSYYTFQKKKVAIITDRLMNNNSFFIGHLNDVEKDVINYLYRNKTARAEDMASFLEDDINKTIEKLETLYKLRLIRKDKSNKDFIYMSV